MNITAAVTTVVLVACPASLACMAACNELRNVHVRCWCAACKRGAVGCCDRHCGGPAGCGVCTAWRWVSGEVLQLAVAVPAATALHHQHCKGCPPARNMVEQAVAEKPNHRGSAWDAHHGPSVVVRGVLMYRASQQQAGVLCVKSNTAGTAGRAWYWEPRVLVVSGAGQCL